MCVALSPPGTHTKQARGILLYWISAHHFIICCENASVARCIFSLSVLLGFPQVCHEVRWPFLYSKACLEPTTRHRLHTSESKTIRFLLNDTWLCDSVYTHVTFQNVGHGALMAEWVCRWKPFGISSGNSSQKSLSRRVATGKRRTKP